MMTLRERKKARTREALADAALQLFAEQGFDQTTVDQIAEAADVARRTFFRYFPSKEAAVFPDRERRLTQFRELLEQRNDDANPLETVRTALFELANDYMENRDRVALQQRIVESSPALLAYDSELDRDWESAIAAALGDHDALPADQRRRARLQAGAIMGAVRAIFREWYESRGQRDLQALGQEAFALLRNGLKTDDRRGDA